MIFAVPVDNMNEASRNNYVGTGNTFGVMTLRRLEGHIREVIT